MKKLTLIFCLFAATIAQAQTKEETILWIKEKLEKSQNYKVRVEVAECEVKIIYDWGMKIYSVPGITITKGQYKIGDVVSDCVDANYKGFKGCKQIQNTGKIDLFYSMDICELTEENIIERLQKAFNHLATFCPQKKEAF